MIHINTIFVSYTYHHNYLKLWCFEMISFQEAIDQTEKSNRIILLGNGFSISLCKSFSYKRLYEVARDELPENDRLSTELCGLFNDLETEDFEKVLAHLEVANIVMSHYKKGKLKNSIQKDFKKVGNIFAKSILHVHPRFQNKIELATYTDAIGFFENFSKIFTLNYDLLLYWTIMNKMELEKKGFAASIPIRDGFGKKASEQMNNLVWSTSNPQDVFYLHGAIHLYEDEI